MVLGWIQKPWAVNEDFWWSRKIPFFSPFVKRWTFQEVLFPYVWAELSKYSMFFPSRMSFFCHVWYWVQKQNISSSKKMSKHFHRRKRNCLWSRAKLLFCFTFSRGFYFPCVEPSEKWNVFSSSRVINTGEKTIKIRLQKKFHKQKNILQGFFGVFKSKKTNIFFWWLSDFHASAGISSCR